MFERYTEFARQSVFFGRYEASQFGSSYIETEHLLLGVLRADRELALRLLGNLAKVEAMRVRIGKERPRGQKGSGTIDLPLSHECKRVLAHAAEEAQRLNHKHITHVHLLLGVVREPECLGARLMREAGIAPSEVELAAGSEGGAARMREATPFLRDLTSAAAAGALGPLVGRERELQEIVTILLRRRRNNPALVGEPGVGKMAIVEGLASKLAEGDTPLAGRRVYAVEAVTLAFGKSPPADGAVVCVKGLFDLAVKHSAGDVLQAVHMLEPAASSGAVQFIATGTPSGLRHTLEKAPNLARLFEVVEAAPATPDEALAVLNGLKERYEKFHGVAFEEGTLDAAVRLAGILFRDRFLPGSAIDLIDDAGAHARFKDPKKPVTPEVLEEAVAARIGASVEAVRSLLAERGNPPLDAILQNLGAAIPGLASYLARCSREDAEKLVQAIRAAKALKGGY